MTRGVPIIGHTGWYLARVRKSVSGGKLSEIADLHYYDSPDSMMAKTYQVELPEPMPESINTHLGTVIDSWADA